ncbi:MAG: hypothetical protein CFE31_19125 [Rhizobiales bacterium PAR1]|nr:MAG: hypothetical protein CFE31_19125 [Rhizobiales bacterium PAR1]
MVPNTLDDWNFDVINTLCQRGNSESDRHDFKGEIRSLHNLTKICCAFSNSYGGFVIVGVSEKDNNFEITGIDSENEIYSIFCQKIKAEPQISIPYPKIIEIPHSTKFIYVFHIPKSTRRPHLPSMAAERIFWKRREGYCEQMTLEEIRYQMNSYEEKIEKLALLLIELHFQRKLLHSQSLNRSPGYETSKFSIDLIKIVISETYAQMKDEHMFFSCINGIITSLNSLNVKKDYLMNIQSQAYDLTFKNSQVDEYYNSARMVRKDLEANFNFITSLLERKFNITIPFS